MHRSWFLLCAALGLLPALSACLTTGQQPLRLYQRDSGGIVNMQVGDTLEVILDGDPTTDVHWLQPPDDPGILDQLGETEYQTDIQTYTAPQRLRLRFKAVMEGRTRLQLTYPSKTDQLEDRVFDMWVVVKVAE